GGETWEETVLENFDNEQMFATNKPLRAVTYGNGMFVAIGPNHVLYSRDGLDWKYVRTGKLSEEEERRKKAKIKGEYPPDITENLMFPLDVIHMNDVFVVTGGSRDCVVAIYSIFKEKLVLDKKKKLSKQFGRIAKLTSGGLKSIAYDGRSTLVAMTNSDKYIYSNDLGTTWNFSYTPERKPGAGVVYANKTWTAAATREGIFFTADVKSGW
ncbi:MAG: hypothetical protein GY757_61475, partial [bacterium]|nr:hypothetical protein [bacterium]